MQTYPELETARGELTHCQVPQIAIALNRASKEFETECLDLGLGRLRRYRNLTYVRRCSLYNLDHALKRERISLLYYQGNKPSRNPGQK